MDEKNIAIFPLELKNNHLLFKVPYSCLLEPSVSAENNTEYCVVLLDTGCHLSVSRSKKFSFLGNHFSSLATSYFGAKLEELATLSHIECIDVLLGSDLLSRLPPFTLSLYPVPQIQFGKQPGSIDGKETYEIALEKTLVAPFCNYSVGYGEKVHTGLAFLDTGAIVSYIHRNILSTYCPDAPVFAEIFFH